MTRATRITDVARVGELLVAEHPKAAGEVLQLVASAGALLEGHFTLQSGSHSEYFLRFARFAREEQHADRIATLLLDLAPFVPQQFTVLCPETAGAFLGGAIARCRGADLAIVKVDNRRCPTAELRAGVVARGANVLVVNDVVTTGNSVGALIDLAGRREARILGIAVFLALRPEKFQALALNHHMPRAALMTAHWKTYEPGPACPGCARNEVALPASELN